VAATRRSFGVSEIKFVFSIPSHRPILNIARTVSLLDLRRRTRDIADSAVFCSHPDGSRPGAAGAHFFELPNKIRLSPEQYFTAQGIYRGWALFGFVLLGAIGANLAHAILIRDEPPAFRLALLAFLLMVASLAIFFIWTYPTNQATSNWTVAPANWASLRTQWEYSHAANAVMTFLALCAVTASVLVTKR
jgi:hypothetical protein